MTSGSVVSVSHGTCSVKFESRVVDYTLPEEFPIAVGDVFIYRPNVKVNGGDLNSVPLAQRPAIRACASLETIKSHLGSVFSSSKSDFASRVIEVLSKIAAEIGRRDQAAPVAVLSSMCFVYKCKREIDEVGGAVSSSMMPASRYTAKKKTNAATYVTKTSAKFKGVLSARQLELLFVTWNRSHTFRPLFLLGLTMSEIFAVISNDFINGRHRRRGKCACVSLEKPWCGVCGVPFSIDDSFALDRLFGMITTAPLAFVDIKMETALKIHYSEIGVPSDDEFFAASLTRHLHSLSEDTCDFADEKTLAARPVLECVYGLSFYERGDHTCVCYSDRAKKERECAEVIADAIKGASTLAAFRALDHEVTKGDLTEEQEAAVRAVVSSTGCQAIGVVIITGGPGVGKTRVIGEIANRLLKAKTPFRLTSFTGKAVARIREQTKINPLFSATLDRLIAKKDVAGYEHLIIDEASMVTVDLFARFMTARKRASKEALKITLVGDEDQLPPVGWGCLFSNILRIAEGNFPVFRLTHNFRITPERTSVTILAEAFDTIRRGGILASIADARSDAFSVLVNSVGEGVGEVVSVLKAKIAAGEVASPVDVGIISPLNALVDLINVAVKRVFEEVKPPTRVVEGKPFSIHDRVIMTKNVYFPGVVGVLPHRPASVREKALKCGAPGGCPKTLYGAKECRHCVVYEESVAFGLGPIEGAGLAFMNGDTGTIVDIDEHSAYIDFDAGSENVKFNWKRPSFKHVAALKDDAPDEKLLCDEFSSPQCSDIPLGADMLHAALLKPAFAITVHKSQGSEYKHVIVCLPRASRGDFMNRAMFYTAATRAQKSVTIITPGNFKSIQKIIETPLRARRGNLINRIADICKKVAHSPDEGVTVTTASEWSYYDEELCCM